MGLAISIAAEPLFYIGDFPFTNALFTTYLVILVFLAATFALNRKELARIPAGKSLQNVVEMIVELFLNFFSSIVGHKHARDYFPFLATLFMFILFSNWSGLLPGAGSIGVNQVHHGETVLVPFLRAPSADLNTTLALAIMATVFIWYQGLRTLQWGFLKKFFNFSNPIYTFVGFLELIGEFTRIISFAFRLFGNIFAGEVLLAVMSFLVPVVAGIPFLGLEVFVGIVQSLVFVMLVLVFTAGATAEHHG